jgi:hypothetical protein
MVSPQEIDSCSKLVPFGFALFGIWDLDPHPKLGDLDLHCLGFGISTHIQSWGIWICIVWDFNCRPKVGCSSKLPSLEKIAVFGFALFRIWD